MHAEIIFIEESIRFKMHKVIIDNYGSVRTLNNMTVIAINHKGGYHQFVDKDGIHKVYRLIDENQIEVIYADDSSGFAKAMIIV